MTYKKSRNHPAPRGGTHGYHAHKHIGNKHWLEYTFIRFILFQSHMVLLLEESRSKHCMQIHNLFFQMMWDLYHMWNISITPIHMWATSYLRTNVGSDTMLDRGNSSHNHFVGTSMWIPMSHLWARAHMIRSKLEFQLALTLNLFHTNTKHLTYSH